MAHILTSLHGRFNHGLLDTPTPAVMILAKVSRQERRMSSNKADYIISGGLVVRGSGVTREDVLVRDDKIEAVGTDQLVDF